MIGSLGLPEIIFILVLALLIFGPKRLPEIGRTVGKGLAEFRKASNDLKRTINTELALDEELVPPSRPQSFPTIRVEPAPANTQARLHDDVAEEDDLAAPATAAAPVVPTGEAVASLPGSRPDPATPAATDPQPVPARPLEPS